LLGISASETVSRLYSAEELELVVTESYKGGLVTDNQQQLIQNIFDFSERRVSQVMTPRRRVVAFPSDITEDALRTAIATSPYSRFPIYTDDLDHIIGVLLLKDFVSQQLHQPGEFDLKAMLRPLQIVPESTPVERLLASFKRSHIHIAAVVDEYGGTAGVVTLEDLVEEVVGEVRDEFDQAELPPVREVEPHALVVRGDLLLEDLVEAVNGHGVVTLPDDLPHAGVETVGGLIVTLLGRPAQPGDVVPIEGATLTVESVAGLAVETVRVTLDQASDATGAEITAPDPSH
jgi:CBS domain containing-hemolysin-like protein